MKERPRSPFEWAVYRRAAQRRRAREEVAPEIEMLLEIIENCAMCSATLAAVREPVTSDGF